MLNYHIGGGERCGGGCGEGGGPFVFFKDNGGMNNFMTLTARLTGPFGVRVVYDNGSLVPPEFQTLDKKKLLELVVNDEESLPSRTFHEDSEDSKDGNSNGKEFEIKFRLMHVSRRHFKRHFKLQLFYEDRVLVETIPIEVRSKLKAGKEYISRPEPTVGRPQKRAKRGRPRRVQKDGDAVVYRDFKKILMAYAVLENKCKHMAAVVAALVEQVEVAGALHDVTELLDPALTQHLL